MNLWWTVDEDFPEQVFCLLAGERKGFFVCFKFFEKSLSDVSLFACHLGSCQ